MSLAASADMLHRAVGLLVVLASASVANALTLENLRVKATLVPGSKDPFRVRAQLAGTDVDAMAKGFATIRFGALTADAPTGTFVRRGKVYAWKSYTFGVKKVTINVKKRTIDIRGGGIDLGDFPGPVRLVVGTRKGVACGTFEWANAQATRGAAAGKGASRRVATGPLEPCFPPPTGDELPPNVAITSPTAQPGVAVGTPTVGIGGIASDDVALAGLTWESDMGGGGSIAVAADWSVAGLPVVPGDNRITVTATDASNNTATDVLDVTYNTNGVTFEGMPTASPDGLTVGDSESVQVRQKILANPDLDPATVQIERIEDNGAMTVVKPIKDDGIRQTGDQLPGDDVYSTYLGIDGGTEAVPDRFRVSASTLSSPSEKAWSPVLTIPRAAPLEDAEIAGAVALADNALDLFQSLVGDGIGTDAALAEVVLLAKASGALAAGPSDGGLGAWWVNESGLLGGMLGYDQTTKRGGTARTTPPRDVPRALPRVVSSPSAALPSWSEVGSRRTLVLAPYFENQEALAVGNMLDGMQCPQYEVESFFGSAANADRFKNLEEYGLILIASHGDALFDSIGSAYRPEWAWPTPGSQPIVLTGTNLTQAGRNRFASDLRLGRMAVFQGGTAGILPSFFTRHSFRLPASLVYVGSCRSSGSAGLSSALLDLGAGAYLGFDGYVDSAFASATATTLFTKLIQGESLTTAFTPGSNDGAAPPATFTVDGNDALSLATGPVVNRSFEVQSGFLASVAGFDVAGDGRIIGNLGSTLPTEGARMALVSTGLGLTTQSGQFYQNVCLPPIPPGKTKLMLYYDWNFFSEEFLEFCGSQFQDYFQVLFGGYVLQSTKIDDLCNDPGITLDPSDVGFDQGGVYDTGWITQAVDITTLAGTTDNLRFKAGDVGDSVYDTVILVDNVRLVFE